MSERSDEVLTARLRLVPISPKNAGDLWLIHNDDAVVPWYDGWRPTWKEAEERAADIAESWRLHEIHKWIAYDLHTDEVIGRGGLSRTPIDDDWGQLYAFLPQSPWVYEAYSNSRPFETHANWLEIGWALRRDYWGHGYAAEVGAAGLSYAFETLDMEAVVSCTALHNARAQAVMERIGLRFAGVIHSPGIAEGEDQMRDDAPFNTHLILREAYKENKP